MVAVDPADGVRDMPPLVADRLPPYWPHREASRWVEAAGLAWHVQVFEGQGGAGLASLSPPSPAPMAASVSGAAGSAGTEMLRQALPPTVSETPQDLLLLHGAGASAHSWRDIAPALAAILPRGARVIVPDLPGHAFTARPADQGLSLPGMAGLLKGLLWALDARAGVLIGHSAGAAVATRMALEAPQGVRCVISLNGAWLPPAGQGRWFYAPLARLFALNPWVPHVFAFHASHRGPLERLIASTGSRLDAAGMDLYARLVSDHRHVAAVLAMMTAWDLRPLLADLPRLQPALHLLVAEGDRTVPLDASLEAARRQPRAVLHRLPGLGHLAHEEAPHVVLDLLHRLLGQGEGQGCDAV